MLKGEDIKNNKNMDNKIKIRGTGAGGDKTNKNGLPYEELTELKENERFLVTPHTEVLEYVSRKGNDRDRWISGMQRLQERYEDWKPGDN